MCDEAGLDFPGPYMEMERRARKPNRCDVCREPIQPGDRYHFSSGRWDSGWGAYRHCLRCWAMFLAANQYADGEADLLLSCGEVWEDPPETVAALAFATRAEMQAPTTPGTEES